MTELYSIYQRCLNAISIVIEKFTLALFLCALLASCNPQRSSDKPLTERGYLWQREWTDAVNAALTSADRNMDGIIVLGTDIQWNAGKPNLIRANLSWETTQKAPKTGRTSTADRALPGTFVSRDPAAETIIQEATRLIREASNNEVNLSELQLDFDCPQNKGSGANFKKGRRADPGALGEREPLACQNRA